MNFGYEADQIYGEILKRGNEYDNESLARLFQSFWDCRDKLLLETQEENRSLKRQVDSLKKENDLIWKKYVEDIAELKVQNRIMGPITLVPANKVTKE